MPRLETPHDFSTPVIATVEALGQNGINPEDLILWGSGVMALYGLRRPHDADFIVHPRLFDQLRQDRHIPNTQALFSVAVGRMSRMRARLHSINPPAEDALPLDITTFSQGDRERQFEALRAGTIYSEAAGIAHVSLEQVVFDKIQPPHRIKDRIDAFKIRRFLGKPALQAYQHPPQPA